MSWTTADARVVWRTVYEKFALDLTGPSRNSTWSTVKSSVKNTWELFKQRSLLDPHGRAKLGVAAATAAIGPAAGAAVGVGIAAAARLVTPVAQNLTSGISTALDFGLGSMQSNAISKAIGNLDGDEASRRKALARQMSDSQAAEFFAVLMRLGAELEKLSKTTKVEGCADLEKVLSIYFESRFLNNNLAKHVAYLEALAQKGRSVMTATKIELDKKEQELEKLGVDLFEHPEWHESKCSSKRHCYFPWDEHERKKPHVGVPVTSSATTATVAGRYAPGTVSPLGAPPLPPKPGIKR